jgi:hypothetical protein
MVDHLSVTEWAVAIVGDTFVHTVGAGAVLASVGAYGVTVAEAELCSVNLYEVRKVTLPGLFLLRIKNGNYFD